MPSGRERRGPSDSQRIWRAFQLLKRERVKDVIIETEGANSQLLEEREKG
jgi:hypothetical protein